MKSPASLYVVTIASVLVMVATGCSDGPTDHDAHSQPHEHAEQHVVADQSHQPDLQRNGTERWKMDDHTREVFTEMAALALPEEPAEMTLQKRKELGLQLQDGIARLIQGCTMTGTAHDELHKFLQAYIPAVELLAKNGSEADHESVQELLQLYPEYFE